jgi:hypothetical protein
MAIELAVPDDIDFAGCDSGEYRSWGPEDKARSHQGPGQRDLVWIVDVSGNGVFAVDDFSSRQRLIVDAAVLRGMPVDVLTEIQGILDSIVVGHWG